MFIILAVIIPIVLIIYGVHVENKSKRMLSKRFDNTYVSDNKTHTIRRIDNKPISDEEVSDLIKLGYQHAIEREKQSKNIKFHRTSKEEELSFQFEMNHGDGIDKHVSSFEECYELACEEDDLSKKIELLEKTIIQFEKARTWFYRTKGGTIYFQDMYEHLHNSRNDDFSYIDQVKEDLDEYIEERDYIISEILEIIKSSDGILQKDIYQHLPDVSRADVQRIIRHIESEGLITKEKSKNSYLLTIKEKQ